MNGSAPAARMASPRRTKHQELLSNETFGEREERALEDREYAVLRVENRTHHVK